MELLWNITGKALEIFEKLGEKPNIEIAKKNLERMQKLKQRF